MTQALTFNDITLTPIPHQNSLWIRAAELARALGYSDTRKVTHLYERNADEFTPEMTQVIEISDVPEMGTLENLKYKARIFSLRGCHLVAMFARTPVAKAFRKWVLDVLEKYAAEQTALSAASGPDATLPLSTTEDRKPLRALVGSWAKLANAPFDACWNQLKAAFQLATIRELPQAWLPDALAWVQEKIDALPAPLPSGDRPPLFRDGAFHLPSPNPRHIPGPREAALMALWKDWGHRARELERQFRELSREVDACRGDLFAHAVSDLGRHADTCFSTDALLDGLYASQTVAEDQFKWAMTSLMCQLRLCLNVAVAMGR